MQMILNLAGLVLIGYLVLHFNFLLVSPNFQLHSPYIRLSVSSQIHFRSINTDLKKYGYTELFEILMPLVEVLNLFLNFSENTCL